MQLDLAHFRHMHTDDNTASKALLYWYSKYSKERAEAAKKKPK